MEVPEIDEQIESRVTFKKKKKTQVPANWVWEIPKWDETELLQQNKFHCSAVYHKSLWTISGGYDPSLPFGWEDWDFWIRITERGSLRPYRIKEPLFKYRIRPNAMHNFCQKNYVVCFALMKTLHPYTYSKDVYSFQFIIKTKHLL